MMSNISQWLIHAQIWLPSVWVGGKYKFSTHRTLSASELHSLSCFSVHLNGCCAAVFDVPWTLDARLVITLVRAESLGQKIGAAFPTNRFKTPPVIIRHLFMMHQTFGGCNCLVKTAELIRALLLRFSECVSILSGSILSLVLNPACFRNSRTLLVSRSLHTLDPEIINHKIRKGWSVSQECSQWTVFTLIWCSSSSVFECVDTH